MSTRKHGQQKLPAAWALQPIGTIAQVSTSTVDKKDYAGQLPVRLANYTDVYYKDIIEDDPMFMQATASADQIARFSVRAHDVAITKDSETPDDIGVSAYAPLALPQVVWGYHLAIYRARDVRYAKFIKRLFDSQQVRSELAMRTPGITRVGLSANTLRYLRVPVPPPHEALRIADYLDRELAEIDAFIADQEATIGLLLERREAAIYNLVLGRRNEDEKRYVPRGPWIAPIPSAWRVQPLWSMFQRVKDVNHPEETMLSVFRQHGVVRKDDFGNLNKTAENRDIYQLVHPGWLVTNRMKAWQGAVGISPYRGIVSGHYLCFLPTHQENPDYLNFLFRSRAYVDGYKQLSRGVRPGQAEIDNDEYRRMPVILPSLHDQAAIVRRLRDVDAAIHQSLADTREALMLLRERRAALISAAVTGKIDVTARKRVFV